MQDIFAFRRGVTKHGLEVFVKTVRVSPPQVCVGLVTFVGMRQDPIGMTGLSHAVEHAMGIAGSDSGDFFKAQRFAIEHGFFPEEMGSTGPESTWRIIRGDACQLEAMLRFFAEYTNALPAHLSMKHLREIHLREFIEMGSHETPAHYAALRIAFPEGHPALRYETEEDINRWTRGAIKEHFARYYTLPNMALVIAGTVTLAEAMRMAERIFPARPIDNGARRTSVAPISASVIRCGQYVIRLNDIVGQPSDDNENGDECFIWRMRTAPLSLMHEHRAKLCLKIAYSACLATLREKLGLIYAVEPTAETFRDLRFCRLGIEVACKHAEACIDVFTRIPDLVRRRGKRWFEIEREEMLLKLKLKHGTLSGLVLASLMDLSVFGYIQPQVELMNVLKATTWRDALAGVEELFASDKSLMVTIVS